jgi:hypothetical protein
MASKLDWQAKVDGFSDVMKLVHLAMRRDPIDRDAVKADLLRMGRRAYESELMAQARRAGCPGPSAQLSNGPILSELNEVYEEHADSIVNTYNYDLTAQIQQIRQDVPRANRFTYANRLQRWDETRKDLKKPVIGQMTESVARTLAQQHFYQYNGYGGTAELQPKTAVCPVCQGWIDRGIVPLKVAENHPPPYHIRCPHSWYTTPDQRTPEECRLLWMGE